MKKLDPFYWYLRLIHLPVISKKLKDEELVFLHSNLNKHRLIQWVNVIAAVLLILALIDIEPAQMDIVITSLIAPVMVMGTAWFAVSFGSIPVRLVNVSMVITFWMYLAFKVSLTAMFLAIAFVVPPYLWPVLGTIYLAIDFSCALYDSVDALKAGLDEAVLKHSRAALIYYKDRAGINVEEKNE